MGFAAQGEAVSRRKGPKMEAWKGSTAILHVDGTLELMGGPLAEVRKEAEVMCGRALFVAEVDPDRERHAEIGRLLLEERAAMRALEYADTRDEREPASARHESARKRLAAALAAVEKLQRKGRK